MNTKSLGKIKFIVMLGMAAVLAGASASLGAALSGAVPVTLAAPVTGGAAGTPAVGGGTVTIASWVPALTDSKFAPETIYRATLTVTSSDLGAPANSVVLSVTGADSVRATDIVTAGVGDGTDTDNDVAGVYSVVAIFPPTGPLPQIVSIDQPSGNLVAAMANIITYNVKAKGFGANPTFTVTTSPALTTGITATAAYVDDSTATLSLTAAASVNVGGQSGVIVTLTAGGATATAASPIAYVVEPRMIVPAWVTFTAGSVPATSSTYSGDSTVVSAAVAVATTDATPVGLTEGTNYEIVAAPVGGLVTSNGRDAGQAGFIVRGKGNYDGEVTVDKNAVRFLYEIDQKAVTVSSTGHRFAKDYDGTDKLALDVSTIDGAAFGTSASVISFANGSFITLSGVEERDARIGRVTIAYLVGAYASAAVGAGKSVTLDTLILGGSAATNYKITGLGNSGSGATVTCASQGTISPKTLIVTGFSAGTKVYDGDDGIAVTGTPSATGVVDQEVVNVSAPAPVGKFITGASVGENKLVVVTGFVLSGANASNYVAVSSTITGSITHRPLTITGLSVSNKTYDGLTTAVVNGVTTLQNRVAGDNVTVVNPPAWVGVGQFDNPNVGTDKPVTVDQFTLGGTALSNYSLTQPTFTATITRATVTLNVGATSMTVDSLEYNGSNAATIRIVPDAGLPILTGAVNNEYLFVAGPYVGTYDNERVGNSKVVTLDTINGFRLSGATASNYTMVLGAPGNIPGRRIVAKKLTISGLLASDKVYDGATTVEVTGTASLDGAVGNDDVALATVATRTYSFATAGADTAKAINISPSFTVVGSAASNYTLNTVALKANVTKRRLSISNPGDLAVTAKVYNGTTAATVTGTATLDRANVVTGETVNLAPSAVATYADANVGASKPVTVTYSLTGSTAVNYEVEPVILTGDITGKELIVTTSTLSSPARDYNGTRTATVNVNSGTIGFTGAIGSDNVVINGPLSGTYAAATVGAQTIEVTGFTLSGTAAGNYVVRTPVTINGTINRASLTIAGLSVQSKVYDNSRNATLIGTPALSGVAPGESYTLVGTASGQFATETVGTGKTVAVSGLSLDTAAARNYTLVPLALTGAITARPLTVASVAHTKKQDGTTTIANIATAFAPYIVLDSIIAGDNVSILATSVVAAYTSAAPGTKTVAITAASLTGARAAQYTFATPVTVEVTGGITHTTAAEIIAAAKTVLEGVSYGSVKQSTLNNEGLAKAWIESAIFELAIDPSVNWTVFGVSPFVPAVAGSSTVDMNGTNGSYTFRVALRTTDGAGTEGRDTVSSKTLTITATRFGTVEEVRVAGPNGASSGSITTAGASYTLNAQVLPVTPLYRAVTWTAVDAQGRPSPLATVTQKTAGTASNLDTAVLVASNMGNGRVFVVATSTDGERIPSRDFAVDISGQRVAPQNFTVVAGLGANNRGQAILKWREPGATNPASTPTAYQYSTDGSSWFITSSDTMHTVSDLLTGFELRLSVRAVYSGSPGPSADSAGIRISATRTTVDPNAIVFNTRSLTYTGSPQDLGRATMMAAVANTANGVDPFDTLYQYTGIAADGLAYTSGDSVPYASAVAPTKAGSYVAKVTFRNSRFLGSKSVAYTIAPKAMAVNMLTLQSGIAFTYDGAVKTPSYEVKDGNAALSPNTDFRAANGLSIVTGGTAEYVDAVNASTNGAAVSISGINNYTGTISRTFSIAQKNLAVDTALTNLGSVSKVYDGTNAADTNAIRGLVRFLPVGNVNGFATTQDAVLFDSTNYSVSRPQFSGVNVYNANPLKVSATIALNATGPIARNYKLTGATSISLEGTIEQRHPDTSDFTFADLSSLNHLYTGVARNPAGIGAVSFKPGRNNGANQPAIVTRYRVAGVDTTLAPVDSGSYEVRVYVPGNERANYVSTSPALLGTYVIGTPLPPVLTDSSSLEQQKTVRVGDNLILSVAATSPNGTAASVSYQWYKDDEPIATGGRAASYRVPTDSVTSAEVRYYVVITNTPGASIQVPASRQSPTTAVTVIPAAKSIAGARVEVNGTFEYTGEFHRPDDITVTLGGVPLSNGYEYEIKYSNNQNAGRGRVTAVGIGDYKDSVAQNFIISKKQLEKDDFDFAESVEYNNGAALPIIIRLLDGLNSPRTGLGRETVRYNGSTTAPTEAGKYTVSVSFADGQNFIGTGDSVWTYDSAYVIYPKAPLKTDLTYDASKIGDFEYAAGVTRGVGEVALKGTKGGSVRVLYNNSETAPSELGDYEVIAEVEGGANYDYARVSLGWIKIATEVSVAGNDRVIPGSGSEVVVVAPVQVVAGEFTVGPNPVAKASGKVGFFWQGKVVKSGTLYVFDASGNLVAKVSVSDNGSSTARREIGSWNLTAKGAPVSEGTYLVKGALVGKDGSKVKVSSILGVAR